MKSPAKRIGTVGALVTMLASAALLGLTASPASAQAGSRTGTYAVTPTSGPVGTVVTLQGNVSPSCVATAAQKIMPSRCSVVKVAHLVRFRLLSTVLRTGSYWGPKRV